MEKRGWIRNPDQSHVDASVYAPHCWLEASHQVFLRAYHIPGRSFHQMNKFMEAPGTSLGYSSAAAG